MIMPSFQQHETESESCSVMSDSLQPHGLYSPWNSPGQNTGVVSLSLLQGIFPTQGSNPGLLHFKWILYQLSHKGSPRIWVAYSFSSSIETLILPDGNFISKSKYKKHFKRTILTNVKFPLAPQKHF